VRPPALSDQQRNTQTFHVGGVSRYQDCAQTQCRRGNHQIHRPPPRAAALLLKPSAQKPIVVGRHIGKRDPVAIDRLNQRQAVLARQPRLVAACGVHAKVQLCVTDRADLARQP